MARSERLFAVVLASFAAACATTRAPLPPEPDAATPGLYAGRSTTTFGTQLPVSSAAEADARARASAAKGDVDMTLYYLLRAAELAPEDGAPLLKVGMIHESRGRLAMARSAYELGLTRQPTDRALLERLGLVCVQLGDDERAATVLAGLDEPTVATWQIHNALGIVADRAGRHADAIARFGRALELQPKAAPVLNNRGWSRLSAGDVAGAEQDFRASLALTELSSARANLGAALARQGRYSAALDHLLRVFDVAESLNRVGEAALANGDLTVAHDYFERAAEASPRWFQRAHANLLVADARLAEVRGPAAATPRPVGAGGSPSPAAPASPASGASAPGPAPAAQPAP
jgi:Flp pilus assembly protein TadD